MPGYHCQYVNCYIQRGLCTAHMYRFPVKDEERLLKWIINSGNEPLLSLEKDKWYRKRICENHFPPEAFINSSKHRLTISAVPINYKELGEKQLGSVVAIPSTSKWKPELQVFNENHGRKSRWCIVLKCIHTSKKNPHKIFIRVPVETQTRKWWLQAAGRDSSQCTKSSEVFICEDHFNLKDDLVNYLEWKIMGLRKCFKRGVIPHRFDCHNVKNEGSTSCLCKVFTKLLEQERVKDESDAAGSSSLPDNVADTDPIDTELFVSYDDASEDPLLQTKVKNESNIEPEPMDYEESTIINARRLAETEDLFEISQEYCSPVLYGNVMPEFVTAMKTDVATSLDSHSFKKEVEATQNFDNGSFIPLLNSIIEEEDKESVHNSITLLASSVVIKTENKEGVDTPVHESLILENSKRESDSDTAYNTITPLLNVVIKKEDQESSIDIYKNNSPLSNSYIKQEPNYEIDIVDNPVISLESFIKRERNHKLQSFTENEDTAMSAFYDNIPSDFECSSDSCVSDEDVDSFSYNIDDPEYSYDRLSQLPKATVLDFSNSSNKDNAEPEVQQIIPYSKKKRTRCKFCGNYVTNFERHLTRHHPEEPQVKAIFKVSKEDRKERRKILALIRFESQFEKCAKNPDPSKLPCVFCKRFVSSKYLNRHYTKCPLKSGDVNLSNKHHKAQSQTLLACASDSINVSAISDLLKEKVFPRMKADDISFVAKSDPLIRYFGENYLKKYSGVQIHLACSNKLRESARFLIEMRLRTNTEKLSLFDALSVAHFDYIVASGKAISGYDEETKQFSAPSLAIHLGTLLKQICSLCSHLLLKGIHDFKCDNIKSKLKDIKHLKILLHQKWSTEMSSLPVNDLESNANKPLNTDLIKDIMKLKDYALGVAERYLLILKEDNTNSIAYQKLIQAAFILTVLFNRKQLIDDVQGITVKSYKQDYIPQDQHEFLEHLTYSEKVLTKSYKKVAVDGRNNRIIVLVFPKKVQEYIDLILAIRSAGTLPGEDNVYLFSYPIVRLNQWRKVYGRILMKTYAKYGELDYPEAFTSSHLQKQIAMLMCIMDVSKEEYTGFANFLGYIVKSEEEFYEIMEDAHQIAKIYKLLTLIDNGRGLQFKSKTLDEIELDALESHEFDDENETKYSRQTNIEPDVLSKSKIKRRISKKNTKSRIRWTNEQRLLVKKYFKRHIDLKKVPRKDECVKLLKDHPNTLHNLDWVKVKTFVYNVYTKSNNNKEPLL